MTRRPSGAVARRNIACQKLSLAGGATNSPAFSDDLAAQQRGDRPALDRLPS